MVSGCPPSVSIGVVSPQCQHDCRTGLRVVVSRALQSNDPAGLPKQRALRQANALFEDEFMYTLLCCLSHARVDFLPTVVEIGMPGESVKGLVVTDR